VDVRGWDEFYRRTRARLIAYARRRLPTADEADDAVAEAYLRAYERTDLIPARGTEADAWLFGVLRNVIREMRRDRARRQRRLSTLDIPDDATDARLIANEEAEAVRAAFACLDRADQELLRMRLVERLTATEVARRLGKRPGAVRMAQARALVRLRSLLDL
jgi:RNA polymerase sigma-70 factor (ECF subfamily)